MARVNSNLFIEHSLMAALSFLKESLFADEYASHKGLLQARDPRIKTLSILALLLAVLFAKDIVFLICVYALCLLFACFSSIDIVFFLKRTWLFIPLFSLCIALPAIFNIFTPGEPLVSFGTTAFSISVTRQGIASAGFFFMRVLTSVSLCILLVLTTRHYALLKVLRAFGVPQVFVMTLGMCYRYVYLFIEMLQSMCLAIKSRVGFIASAKKGQRIVAWNIASLWQRSYQMQGQVYSAMLSRGYAGEPQTLGGFHTEPKDIVFLGIAIFVFIGVLWQTYFLN